MMYAGDKGAEVPRRICIDKATPAELAIRAAMRAVEDLPPDLRLTNAMVQLAEALDSVADFVDGVEVQP